MQVIWSRLDAVDEGERLRIEARLESLTRQAPVTRVLIEGSPPDAGGARETVRITGKVDGTQVVAIRDEPTLGEALEYALRAFEESIARMSARWAEKKKLEAVAPPPPAAKPVAAAPAPAQAPPSTRLRGPAPKVIELAPEKPSFGSRISEQLGSVLEGVLATLEALRAWLPRRSPRFRKASLGVSLVALVIALAAQRCGFDRDLGAVAGAPRSFSAEAGAAADEPAESFSATSRGDARSAPAPRSFSARAPASQSRSFSSSAESEDELQVAPPRVPRFSAESEDSGLGEDMRDPDPLEPAPEEELDPSDPLAEPPEPEAPGVLRRRR